MIDVTVLDQWKRPVSGATVEAIESTSVPRPHRLGVASFGIHMTQIPSRPAGVFGVANPATGLNLAPSYNRIGIYTDGSTFPGNGGLDLGGNAYSSALLGTSLTFRGVALTFGPANVPDCVANASVALGGGVFATLILFATAVNGNQPQQNFTVTYTDGTTENHVRGVSDWSTPQNFAGEKLVLSMAYRNLSTGLKDNRTFYLYGYLLPLIPGKSVNNLIMPANNNVVLMAATLTPNLPLGTTLAVFPSSAQINTGGTQVFNAVLT